MVRLTRASMALLVVLVGCADRQPPANLPAPPNIIRFKADRDRISAGEQVTLSWTVERATSVTLVDQTGAKLPIEADELSGQATLQPKTTSFYVLRATGPGGSHSDFVQVAVNEDLERVLLVAVPQEVDAGGEVQLLWSAFDSKSVTLEDDQGEQIAVDASAGSGVVTLTPDRTRTWTLTAQAIQSDQTFTASTRARIRPQIASFTVTPEAARPGETMVFSWRTGGGSRLVIAEDGFGPLHRADRFADIDEGTFSWTMPESLPGGAKLVDSQPLHFTLSVEQDDPDVRRVAEVRGHVGEGPRILDVAAPPAVTAGRSFLLSWGTRNATRLQVFADGQVIFEPLPTDAAQVASGQVTLAAPAADSVYKVKAWDHLGASTERSVAVRVVQPPMIQSFTVAASVTAPGTPATAAWTTRDATRAVIRVRNGPTVFVDANAATVAQGTTELYAGLSTTFVLEAYNDAGDLVTREVSVVVEQPGQVVAGPTPVAMSNPVTAHWTLAPTFVPKIFGDPAQAPVKTRTGTTFVDLAAKADARRVIFSDQDDGVREITARYGFRFPFLGTINQHVWVSTNGFVAFGETDPEPFNSDLSTGTSGAQPPMIAPFWDDLVLGPTGEVLYLVEGDSFPRRLIVQWNEVQTKDAGSELTFQVQLLESGEFRFAYKTLTGSDAAGQGASVGWAHHGMGLSLSSKGAAILAANDAFSFFANGAAEGEVSLTPDRSGTFVLFGKLANDQHIVYPSPINVVGYGSVVVSEVLPWPESSAPRGRWAELRNVTAADVELSGLELIVGSLQNTFTFPDRLVLPAGGYLVVGESSDPMLNGGVPVGVEWTGFTPTRTSDETLTLSASGEIISELGYQTFDVNQGISVQPHGGEIDGLGARLNCPRSVTFGGTTLVATPGAQNESCFEYVVEEIPVHFRDISGSGVPLLEPVNGELQAGYRDNVSLALKPFPFFGQPQPLASVSVNGMLRFSSVEWHWENMEIPNDYAADLAIFWDHLEKVPGSDGNVYVQRIDPGTDFDSPGGHWIFQWNRMTHFEWGAANDDDLSFQIKLFDDGVIEYHYGRMKSGVDGNGDGRSATIWLERPDRHSALPLGINQPVVRSNLAFRFTPNP